MASSAIDIQKLRVVYNPGLFQKKKVALVGLDLQVPPGSVFGFLGQNGAGKTTCIKTLVGLLRATSGKAFILGEDVTSSASRKNIGFMPENPYFYEYLTAHESLNFYGRMSGLNRTELTKRVDPLLDRFGLSKAKDIRMREFSKGMRQRLGLAQALIHEPKVIILDEPMSGLDPLGRHDIREAILEQRDLGRTIFFSSHILSDVEDICDHVCIIHGGKKITEGSLSTLLKREVMQVVVSATGISAGGVPQIKDFADRVWHDGNQYHALVNSEDDAQKAMTLIQNSGGTVRRMEPQHEPLEKYFVRMTSGGGESK